MQALRSPNFYQFMELPIKYNKISTFNVWNNTQYNTQYLFLSITKQFDL